jgi:hypothetical protein
MKIELLKEITFVNGETLPVGVEYVAEEMGSFFLILKEDSDMKYAVIMQDVKIK